jgi:hypothetical protein
MCNQKERVRDHIVLRLLARSQTPMCSWSTLRTWLASLIITQHTDFLLTRTHVHCKTRDTQVLCFDTTIAQNSHEYQPRKFFHYKLYTLPESTSMIPIKMFTKHQTSSSAQSLSLSLSNPSTAARSVTRRSGKTLAFDQAPCHKKTTYYTISYQAILCPSLLLLCPSPFYQTS